MPFLFYAIFINKELLVSFNNAIFSSFNAISCPVCFVRWAGIYVRHIGESLDTPKVLSATLR